MFCIFVAEKGIVLSWIILRQNCKKTWWTGAPGKPCGLLFIFHGLILKAGLASLGTRWRIRHLKPVLRPYVWRYHAQNVIFSFHLHVLNVGRDTELLVCPSIMSVVIESDHVQEVAVTESEVCTTWPKQSSNESHLGGGMCVSMLLGFSWPWSCDWYDQKGEPGSDYHKEIARLIYPTQCSKCPSGVLIFQFQSLS